MRTFKTASLSAAALIAGALVAGAASPAEAVVFRCGDELARQDVSMSAKFEQVGARRKFSVEVESALNTSFHAGDILNVRVENAAGTLVRVGQVRLARVGRDLKADLNLDTVRQPGTRPFPASFPRVVGAGTEVRVGAQLACALQRR